MHRQILHLDVDAFAVSVERVLDPALTGRPVVVGCDAGGRGTVACASYEARRLGVRAGIPVSAARRRAPAAVFLPVNDAACARASECLLALLHAAAPLVEAATIDDFFLDLTGCERLWGGDLVRWAVRLRRDALAATGMPLSMGIAANKLAARVATRLAKPGGILRVIPGAGRDFLEPVSLRILPGVGDATRLRLGEFGVRTAGQLAALGEETLRLLFGAQGADLWRRARGEDHEPVKPSAIHRFIAHEHAFAGDTADPALLGAAAALLAQRLAADLRAHGLRTVRAELTLTYCDGATAAHGVRLPFPSNQDFDFLAPVLAALEAAFRRRVRVRALALRCPFTPGEMPQSDFFAERDMARRARLYAALDQIRRRHGFHALLSARSVAARIPA